MVDKQRLRLCSHREIADDFRTLTCGLIGHPRAIFAGPNNPNCICLRCHAPDTLMELPDAVAEFLAREAALIAERANPGQVAISAGDAADEIRGCCG